MNIHLNLLRKYSMTGRLLWLLQTGKFPNVWSAFWSACIPMIQTNQNKVSQRRTPLKEWEFIYNTYSLNSSLFNILGFLSLSGSDFPCCSVDKLCPTLCDPMNCHIPVLHYLPELVQTQCPLSRWCHPTVSHVSFCPQSFPVSGSFPVSQLFILGGQSVGTSASA